MYRKYKKMFSIGTIIAISYGFSIISIIIITLIGRYNEKILSQLLIIWQYSITILIIITLLLYLIITINGTIYIASKIIGIDYTRTKLSNIIEYYLGSLCDINLRLTFRSHRSMDKNTSLLWFNEKRTIYFGVIFNIILFTIAIFFSLKF